MTPVSPDRSNRRHTYGSKLSSIERILDATYGTPVWHSSAPPLDELVQTILSQHTSDTNSGRAFISLKGHFPTWEEVRDAPTPLVADAIRSGGLAEQKAPRIQAVLDCVLATPDAYTAAALSDVPLATAQDRLTNLPGVGPKTAACVLLFSLGLPAMPVDTHVHRVARRLGLVPVTADAPMTQRLLEAQIGADRDRAYALHINLIRHGRTICLARRPRCERCPLSQLCAYYATHRRDGMVGPDFAEDSEGDTR